MISIPATVGTVPGEIEDHCVVLRDLETPQHAFQIPLVQRDLRHAEVVHVQLVFGDVAGERVPNVLGVPFRIDPRIAVCGIRANDQVQSSSFRGGRPQGETNSGEHHQALKVPVTSHMAVLLGVVYVERGHRTDKVSGQKTFALRWGREAEEGVSFDVQGSTA